MRKKEKICNDWLFIQNSRQVPPQKDEGTPVTLPHTWNAQDGTDGGNDYYRGLCWYTKR